MTWLSQLRQRAGQLKRQALTVYFVARDPRLPRPVRWLALAVAAYALSPIDLIPDFIPVLGLLDDIVLVPLGIALVVRLTPAPVLEQARLRAAQAATHPANRVVVVLIVASWLAVVALVGYWLWTAFD